ncbi:MAG: carbohydrate ABC transporter permease [Spirochaetia bacterium]|jgi:raffinose/stachyose/melibiose transport system permease protein
MKARTIKGLPVYVFLSLYALVILVPMLFILLASFKTNSEIFSAPWSLPAKFNFFTYFDIFINYSVYRYFLNSLYYSVVSVIGIVVLCAMGAYGIVRLKWRLAKATKAYILLGLMVPVHAMIVPLYIMMMKIGLQNPRFTVILIYVAFSLPTSLFILTAYLAEIPRELEEAAVLDGNSLFGSFSRIVVPLMQPALATAAIFAFLSAWNDFFVGLIFINADKYWTIQLGISKFKGAFSIRYSYLLAAVVVALLPTVIVYLFMNRKIIAGITAGAVKG